MSGRHMTPATARQYRCLVRLVSAAECAIASRLPCRCRGAVSGGLRKAAFGGERIDGTRFELAMVRRRERMNPAGAGDRGRSRVAPLQRL
jgi:hypothetical protein